MQSTYTMDDALESTEVSLELLVLEDNDWPLGVLTSISIRISIESSYEILQEFKSKENNLFIEILLGATIWDDSKKERSNYWNMMNY